VVGYFIAIALGMTPVTALYVAVALTFSSTIIIVKLLSDKREVDALKNHASFGQCGDNLLDGRECIEIECRGSLNGR